MTARTKAYLQGTSFVTGQSLGIGSDDMRDLVDSAPIWDAPSAVATPYLLRGTWDGQAYFLANGGTLGSATSGQRTTNTTLLNGLITSAQSAGKFIELQSGLYQIDTPLIVAGGAQVVLRGENGFSGTIIEQFGSNVPVVRIGNTTGTTVLEHADIRGLNLYHGVTQAGLTSSCYMLLGYLQNCRIEDIVCPGVFSGPNFLPYDCVQIAANNNGNFSNIYNNWSMYGWQANGIHFTSTAGGSTGNSWDNIYMNVSSAVAQNAITGAYIFNEAAVQDQQFKRLNCEWGGCNRVIYSTTPFLNWEFGALHVEGVALTGADPCVFDTYGCSFVINAMEYASPKVLAAGRTGNVSLFKDWPGQASSIIVNSLTFLQNQATYQDTTLTLFNPSTGASLDADQISLTINNGFVYDSTGTRFASQFTARLPFDPHLVALANATLQKWNSYTYGSAGSRISRPIYCVTGACTVYGQMEDPVIILGPTGTYNINFAATMGATGTQKPRTGNTATILRPVFTSGVVTLQNAGGALSGGTTNASTTPIFIQFDGTNWVTFTQVT